MSTSSKNRERRPRAASGVQFVWGDGGEREACTCDVCQCDMAGRAGQILWAEVQGCIEGRDSGIVGVSKTHMRVFGAGATVHPGKLGPMGRAGQRKGNTQSATVSAF